jgi:hypothetical protein
MTDVRETNTGEAERAGAAKHPTIERAIELTRRSLANAKRALPRCTRNATRAAYYEKTIADDTRFLEELETVPVAERGQTYHKWLDSRASREDEGQGECRCVSEADCDCDFIASMASLQAEDDDDERLITSTVKAVHWSRTEPYYGGGRPHHLVRLVGGKRKSRTLCGVRIGPFARTEEALDAAQLCDRCKRVAVARAAAR